MKKSLLLAIAVLVSAMSAFGASTSYKSLAVNTDGSVLIEEPWFNSPTQRGTALWINDRSRMNGVCKLFGLGQALATYSNGDMDVTAVIGEAGALTGLNTFNSRYLNRGVKKIICMQLEGNSNPLPSARVKDRASDVYLNDDGSTTLTYPFIGEGSSRVWISGSASDVNGVCRFFGFRNGVVMMRDASDFDITVKIGSNAKIDQFVLFNSRFVNSAIKSLVCR